MSSDLTGLKGIVFGCDFSDPVVADDRDLLEDVLSDLGDFAKEKDCKDACGDAKPGGNGSISQSFAG